MSNLKPIIEESFTQYAGAVLQSRALVDVRDGLKPSARQIFYALYTDKFLPNKPHKSTLKAIGSMARFYIHGDSSGEGVMMRAGQSFAMRYPLTDIDGVAGNLIQSGNWAAPRYTGIRLSDYSMKLFEDIEKDTISDWRDNYDDTEQYPSVLPTKGFYNICNGSMGIGVGLASSIPQYNLREINNALTILLNNPNCSFDEIYCAPDFASGGILLNEAEVKESMKKGTGAACKLRSIVNYNAKERCFEVTEIPFATYTNTICKELEEIVNNDNNPGIDRPDAKNGEKPVVDLTGKTVLIKIYLSKTANPDKVLKYLYANTSLQSYFGINFTMLEMGRFPKVFTWKEMLQAHIDHEKEVYRRSFEFDLKKIKDRIHIIDGLLICLARIEEVVQTIKSSSSTAAASSALQKNFLLDDVQAKAVLDMKLSRLAHLEVKKLEDEREELVKESARIEKILNTEELFNQQLINGWKEVAEKFGDARRTKIINLSSNEEELIEKKQLQISFTNKDALFAIESSTLYTQRRGGVGNKFKLDKDEYVTTSIIVDNTDELLFFTESGNVYRYKPSEIALNQKSYISNYITLSPNERVCALTSSNKSKKYIIFITKDGYLKKSELSEYGTKRNTGIKALNLSTGDHIVSALLCDDEPVGILTKNGNFLITDTSDVRALGRVAAGVHGIKLNDGDEVVSAHLIPDSTTEIVSISKNGLFKKTAYNEFSKQGKNTKGSKIQKLNENDRMADYIPISQKVDLIIGSSLSTIKLTSDDVPLQSKLTLGIKSMKLNEIGEVLKILICE